MGDSYTIDDAKRLCERANVVSFDFLMQELELGLTLPHRARLSFGTRLPNTPSQRPQSLPNCVTSKVRERIIDEVVEQLKKPRFVSRNR
jgi:hypothetical protein